MIQHVCDMCGKVINNYNPKKMVFYEDKTAFTSYGKTYELCDNCYEQVKIYFNNRLSVNNKAN